ncbi:c-type cytochrome [Flavobacteriaceae bacterium R33]|uniref:C-type cytochrome n=2 Tax=Poritiphilus flavus TaxID=2697053 RepID=A0A6L9E7A9_9FLAO|nr:c-type cytochrome [Poritiphilus flavus]
MRFSYCYLLVFLSCFLACGPKEKIPPEGFVIHPEFDLELVASEPLVFDPVEMKFDENGRTYVLEMPGYPLRDAESRLVELLDTDADGIYDQRKMFSENLGVASSFMPYKKGFLVAAPPDLLWIADTDGDGKEDQRQVHMSGFSNENLQHNFNGLTYGLDNWIYAANGGNSGQPYFPGKADEAVDLKGRDMKFDLNSKQIIAFGESSGGFKLTFNEWGHLFETHNLEHISHLVMEDRFLEDLPGAPSHALINVSNHDENGLSRIYPIGEQDTRVNHPEQSGYFSGACGITYYGGGSFPADYRSPVLVADCVLNLVHMDLLSPDETSFEAFRYGDKVEFLASTDRAFRPVNMEVGPGGSLYLLDMHREVIEHPEWIPDEMEAEMDLHAGKEKGRIYKITRKNSIPETTRPDFNTPDSLVTALGHPNQWVRNTAHRLLVTDSVVALIPALKAQLKNSDKPLARLHSMWVLEGLGALEDKELKTVLGDEEAYLRENALKIAEYRIIENSELKEMVLDLVEDKTPRVQMQALLSLNAVQAKMTPGDITGLIKKFDILLQNQRTDTWIVNAMASLGKPYAFALFSNLLELQEEISPNAAALFQIQAQIVGQDGAQKQLALILNRLANKEISEQAKADMIAALTSGIRINENRNNGLRTNATITQALNLIEKDASASLLMASADFRKELGIPLSPAIRQNLRTAYANLNKVEVFSEELLAQLQFVAVDDFGRRAALLYNLLDGKMPLKLQKEALKQLWESGDKNIGRELLSRWENLGPESRKLATDILLYKSENHPLLLSAMEKGEVSLGEFNLDLERRRALLFSDDDKIRKRAEALFSDGGVVTRRQVIDKMRPALELAGNSQSGRVTFEQQCASCHIYGEVGVDVGPVLTEISRKSKETLLHDILDPNAAVDTRYLNHKVVNSEGTIYFGLVEKDTDKEVSLRMTGGETVSIQKQNLSSFTSTGVSMMPEGLETAIDAQQMADLLAFLQGQQNEALEKGEP